MSDSQTKAKTPPPPHCLLLYQYFVSFLLKILIVMLIVDTVTYQQDGRWIPLSTCSSYLARRIKVVFFLASYNILAQLYCIHNRYYHYAHMQTRIIQFSPVLTPHSRSFVHHVVVYQCTLPINESLVGESVPCHQSSSDIANCRARGGFSVAVWAVGGEVGLHSAS